GRPTPEEMHRDGVDWVLVKLIRRENVSSGTTRIHDLAARPLGSFTLRHPLESAVVDDARVFHGVTPVEPIDPAIPAFRDVLVVTMRRA
ncbi:2OG-Fe dioxygenase family protein, partial [Azospirillum sp. B506]|uniref:2OG-Fe dioxygenase family protein n=1 Tax=Azospirillum sp. B506 TaxID=137721 RepID=UPI0005B2D826